MHFFFKLDGFTSFASTTSVVETPDAFTPGCSALTGTSELPVTGTKGTVGAAVVGTPVWG